MTVLEMKKSRDRGNNCSIVKVEVGSYTNEIIQYTECLNSPLLNTATRNDMVRRKILKVNQYIPILYCFSKNKIHAWI